MWAALSRLGGRPAVRALQAVRGARRAARLTLIALALCTAVAGAWGTDRPASGAQGPLLISPPVPATGPLRVDPQNPRYLTDGRGAAVYLTGSHTWNDFQDWGVTDPPSQLDFSAFLDFLARHGHNYTRLYVWEQAAWVPWLSERVTIHPLPYARTGPGIARDGKPRFDLHRWNPAYFARLRDRVLEAYRRGIYTSIMLFNGWSIETKGLGAGNPWDGHPLHRDNNVNGLDGDPSNSETGLATHSLSIPAVLAIQEAYVRKVIETVGDLPNVLWEISNESRPEARAWEAHLVEFVHRIETDRPASHPVGMTAAYPQGRNADLFAGPAEWISPMRTDAEPYDADPPASDGRKVILNDTDHLWGIGGEPGWVWRSFLRGLAPIFMDPYTAPLTRKIYPGFPPGPVSREGNFEAIRRNMGYSRWYAQRLRLAEMAPHSELASSRYCLAAPGSEYLVFLPAQAGVLGSLPVVGSAFRRVTINLAGTSGSLAVEWFNPATGELVSAPDVPGGESRTFWSPFPGDALLHVRAGGALPRS
ncbi:MAG TPA: hypothetical protein VEU07_03380 [Candidatus Acidoferrum sp.]|nr:hypothetical protein [Candidatus Acidoferrum sp.]